MYHLQQYVLMFCTALAGRATGSRGVERDKQQHPGEIQIGRIVLLFPLSLAGGEAWDGMAGRGSRFLRVTLRCGGWLGPEGVSLG